TSPLPEANPGASPSATAGPDIIDVSGPQTFFDDCGRSAPCLGVQPGAQYVATSPYAVRGSKPGTPECTRFQASLALFDGFSYAYRSGAAPLTVHVSWTVDYPGGSTQTLPGVDSTIGPPSGQQGPNTRAQAPSAPVYLHPNG